MLYTLYIDEAGDEGFGKLKLANKGGQSRWFAVGGILVNEENDKLLPEWRDEINFKLDPKIKNRKLHFKHLRHEQKVVACQILANKPLKIFVSLFDKVTFIKMGGATKSKQMLYNLAIASLIEKVYEHFPQLATNNDLSHIKLRVVFSRREGTNYDLMKFILKNMETIIHKKILDVDLIEVENHNNRAGLQLADISTSGFFAAFESNFYGNLETTYAKAMKRQLIFEVTADFDALTKEQQEITLDLMK